MINAKFNLIILVFQDNKGQYNILSKEKTFLDYPSLEIQANIDKDSAIDHLIGLYIEEPAPFHNIKLVDISIDDNILNIYYVVFVTYKTTIKNSFLLDLKTPLNNIPQNAQKIIQLL